MKNRIATVCDACMKVLDGIDKTALVKKNYLTFRGSLSFEAYDKDGQKHFTHENTFMHFCNGKCIDDYMSARVFLKSQYHDANNLPECE